MLYAVKVIMFVKLLLLYVKCYYCFMLLRLLYIASSLR